MSWQEDNDRALAAAVERVRAALVERAANLAGAPALPPAPAERKAKRTASRKADGPVTAKAGPAGQGGKPEPADDSALAALAATFGLSGFERDLLVLAGGCEIDPAFGELCAAAHGDPRRTAPTFGLALAALPEPHWSALLPQRPLRYWRLLEVGTGDVLLTSPLRLDERVLHYLRGLEAPEERLVGLIEAVPAAEELVPSHRALADRVAAVWSGATANRSLPIVQLVGEEAEAKREIASAACATLSLDLMRLPAASLPAAPAEAEGLLRLLGREAALGRRALLLDLDELEATDSARAAAAARIEAGFRGPVLVSCHERRPERGRTVVPLTVAKPSTDEQLALWRSAVGGGERRRGAGLEDELAQLASQFSLGSAAVRAAALAAHSQLGPGEAGLAATAAGAGKRGPAQNGTRALTAALWQAARDQSRPRLESLAQLIPAGAAWDDLVLPERERRLLSEVVTHVRHRRRVYEEWGFGARSARGLGVSALFAGASGTGKTMAAEVLASELQLDLFRIDLASVVSKYIGETEKNLKRVFDAADEGGAILLFDEADALFGKRSEVKDSHDRYANIEVSYLLQRMEAYRGLAVLTTNLKSALDTAFLRRIRFVLQFPFPDAAARAEIWRRIFPHETPLENLDYERLARLGLTGGNIRNVALGAAFLAAAESSPVRMSHLLDAAKSEYAKLEKPLTTTELGGWPT